MRAVRISFVSAADVERGCMYVGQHILSQVPEGVLGCRGGSG